MSAVLLFSSRLRDLFFFILYFVFFFTSVRRQQMLTLVLQARGSLRYVQYMQTRQHGHLRRGPRLLMSMVAVFKAKERYPKAWIPSNNFDICFCCVYNYKQDASWLKHTRGEQKPGSKREPNGIGYEEKCVSVVTALTQSVNTNKGARISLIRYIIQTYRRLNISRHQTTCYGLVYSSKHAQMETKHTLGLQNLDYTFHHCAYYNT